MAFTIQGVLRRGITAASTAVRQRCMHNAPNQTRNMDTKRLLQDLRHHVAAEAERITVALDTESHPFRRVYKLLGIRGRTFNPAGFWRWNLSYSYLFSLGFAMDLGRVHAKWLMEERNAEKKLDD